MTPDGWTLAVDPLPAAGLALAAVCCAGVGLWWNPPPGGGGRRFAVGALRLAAVSLVALLLLGPERRPEGVSEPVPLTVLADLSASTAADRDGMNRLLEEWAKERTLAVRPFAARLAPPRSAGPEVPDAAGPTDTDVAGAIRAALGEGAVRRSGRLVVVTDGRSTVGPAGRASAAAEAAREAGVRLVIIGVGEPDPLGGPRPPTLSATRPLGPGEPVRVAARWTFADGPPAVPPRFTAQLAGRDTGAVVAAGPVTIEPDGAAAFAATFAPNAAGRQVYDFTLTADDAPVPAASGVLTLDVPDESPRVLLIADRPRHEARFLRALLTREPTVRLTAVVGEEPLPAGDEPFDVLIVLERVPRKPGGSPSPRGGAPARDDFAEATGRITVLADAPAGPPSTEPLPVAATVAGRRLGCFLADPPPIFGRLEAPDADPAAAVLATAGGAPLVTLRRTAAGARLTVRSPQTWRWRNAAEGDPHRRFWLAALRLAAAPPDTTPLLRVEPATIEAGGTATVTAEGAAPTAVRVDGPGVSRTVAFDSDGAATLAGLPPGRFRLAPVSEAGDPAGAGRGIELTVTAPPAEGERPSQDRADLVAAAKRSRGRYVALQDAGALADLVPPPPIARTAGAVERPAETWWPAALLAALLGGEWLLRRSAGGV